MRKKEAWMFKGARVLAGGKEGIIRAMQENRLNEVDYVYYIDVRLIGERHSGRYHPDDISELTAAVPQTEKI